MAWTKIKTAVVVGVGVLLAAGTTTVAVVEKANQKAGQLAHAGTTQIGITGNPGAVITGYYVQSGQRFAVSNSLPWSFSGTNISQFEFRKANREDTVVLALEYQGTGMFARTKPKLDSKLVWIEGKIENGLITICHPN